MSLFFLSWSQEGGLQDSGHSCNLKRLGRRTFQSSRATHRLCRMLWGCSFRESSSMLWWVLQGHVYLTLTHPHSGKNQSVSQRNKSLAHATVNNCRRLTGSLTKLSWKCFPCWRPHLGPIETCSPLSRKCHTMLLLSLMRGWEGSCTVN